MQGIFQKENTDKALKYGIYRHLPTYEKIIRNLVSFCIKNIYYTWEMYKQHLESTLNYEKIHQNYCIKQNQQSAFRNIQIRIHEKKWVLVSKNRTPAIHFLIRHPKMRNAFENMIIPIVEF